MEQDAIAMSGHDWAMRGGSRRAVEVRAGEQQVTVLRLRQDEFCAHGVCASATKNACSRANRRLTYAHQLAQGGAAV